MYLLCILPFLARQFIPVYFIKSYKRKPKLRRWIEYMHFITKLYESILIFNFSPEYPSNCILLRNYTFPRIINYSYRSVKLVKHFSNEEGKGTHTSLSLLRKGKVRRRWPTWWNDTGGEIYIASRKGTEEPGRGLKRGLVGRRRACKNFDFLDGLPRDPSGRSRWLV